jgi:hypothetical protein
VLCRLFRQDKARNASGLRRTLQPIAGEPSAAEPDGGLPQAVPAARGMAPLLTHLIGLQSATGLPPAYLPKDEGDDA